MGEINIKELMKNLARATVIGMVGNKKAITVETVQAELSEFDDFNWSEAKVTAYLQEFDKEGVLKEKKKAIRQEKPAVINRDTLPKRNEEMTRTELIAAIKKHSPNMAISRFTHAQLVMAFDRIVLDSGKTLQVKDVEAKKDTIAFSEMKRPELIAYIKKVKPEAKVSRFSLKELQDFAAANIVKQSIIEGKKAVVKTVQSVVKVKVKAEKIPVERIGRKASLVVMNNNKRSFMTMTFLKKDNSKRTINCKFHNHDALGYVIVKEASMIKKHPKDLNKQFKKVNLQAITDLIVNKTHYKIR